MMAWALGDRLENPHRPSSYYNNGGGNGRRPKGWIPEFIDVDIDFSMFVYPVAINQLLEFEEANDIGVYAFSWTEHSENNGFGVQIRDPSHIYSTEVCHLLFKGHYLFIKNFNSFFSLRPFGVKINDPSCHRCLFPVHGAGNLSKHLKRGKCLMDDGACTVVPRLPALTSAGNVPTLSFEKYGILFDHPLIVYADFETYQSKVVGKTRGEHTQVMAQMTGVASYGYYIVSSVPTIPSSGVIKRASADEFIEDMIKLGLRYRHFCRNPLPMIVTPFVSAIHNA